MDDVFDEVAKLREHNIAYEVKHVSARRARRSGGRPTQFREVQVQASSKNEWLAARGYLSVARSLSSIDLPLHQAKLPDVQTGSGRGNHPADPDLIRELVENEVFCRENRGQLQRNRTQRIGAGIRKGERKGTAVDVVGTCTLCLSEVSRRWRFYPSGLRGRAIFLCGVCIEQLRNKRASGGDAMNLAVNRRRTRG